MNSPEMYVDNKIIPRLTLSGDSVREETIRHHLRRYELAQSYIASDSVAVDLCCGTGYGTGMLKSAGARCAIGVDLSHDAIEFASSEYGHTGSVYIRDSVIDFLSDMPQYPDVITFFEAIEHIPREDGERIIDAARQSISEDGVFLLSTPRDIRSDVNPDHITQWSYGELSEMLHKKFGKVDLFGQDWSTGQFVYGDIASQSSFFVAVCSEPLR